MACQNCQSQARLLVRAATRAGRTAPSSKRYLATAASKATTTSSSSSSSSSSTAPANARLFSTSQHKALFGGMASPYFVVGATERLYKFCGPVADYRINQKLRDQDEVPKLEDGEEVGESLNPGNPWHTLFNMPPTFSTWSHVTMLHLYLLNARIRCFDRDAFANWRQQLIDHFSFEAEKKMHVEHNITSSALRQRYLKDMFTQWRGIMVAYDEGVVKGDAILAAAVWRNLFKGAEDADPRALAAIVGWMRACMKSLEGVSDEAFATRAGEVLALPVESFWQGIEKASKAQASAATAKATVGSTTTGPVKERIVAEPIVGKGQ
ncbi:ubiquinol-cytochrome C chaperone-domain-containing protein [Emericellopsis atlantica]|uniref:Ubiquinol-cytochrome C chaperone-domain-containing protein n=1 Tax=Emericellopsis atlantica TaxID=2614577 RepID=A0A9P7ZS99_9HYPO|nr:ubiquinol-cytochrome C chaperone-domain-containing protein [Emericellopsis atlantica]KAG9257305.1 ubiquinol-cytochrome C chaperone-domain-containing protein [Emericellopsis atlantica]